MYETYPLEARPAAASPARKKRFADPKLTAFTDATEFPDAFPGAAELRRAGYSTYLAVLRLTPEEAATHAGAAGDEVARLLRALHRAG